MKKRILIAVLAVVAAAVAAAAGTRMSDLRVYINPGHGGYTSNDRPIHLFPFERNDSLGYWESKSNLYKGLHIYHILDSLGATPMISRTKNTEADDRNLSEIAAEANTFGADMFFSIHTNAGEDVNYPLMLYREQTIGTPRYSGNVTISEILGRNLYSSKLALWTHPLQISGDLTFYQNMWQGGLGVLRTLYTVGLLSEGGMHEHRPEAYRLMNDDYWWLEAWHFVKSVMEYFETDDRFVTGNVAGIIYDDHNLREKDMDVNFTAYGRDRLAPVNGCRIDLIDAGGNTVQTRTTDQIYNGVYVFRNVAPGSYTLRTSHGDYYEATAQVEVKACEVTYTDMPLKMRREYPLEVVKYSPKSSEGEQVSCAVKIEFDFNADIDTESFERAFSITPATEGFFTYSNNNHHATFTPATAFEPNTAYTVTLSTEARHPDTNYTAPGLAAPLTFAFETRGRNRLEVLDHYPADGGEIHYVSPVVEVRFDARLDPLDILDKVKLVDSHGTPVQLVKTRCKFNTLGQTYGNMQLCPSADFVAGETYTLTVSGDVRDREALPMGQDLTFSFRAVDATAGVAAWPSVNEFDDLPPFAVWADHSVGTSGTGAATRNTSAKVSGSASARFNYAFSADRGGSFAWQYTGDPVVLTSGSSLGLYVLGDLNRHPLMLGVTSGSDVKWLKVCELDFTGWRHFAVSLSELDPSYTYLLAGLKIDQTDSPMCTKGTFGLDALTHDPGPGGIADPEAEAAPAVYYNLQGMRLSGVPTSSGIYICRQGSRATKVSL